MKPFLLLAFLCIATWCVTYVIVGALSNLAGGVK